MRSRRRRGRRRPGRTRRGSWADGGGVCGPGAGLCIPGPPWWGPGGGGAAKACELPASIAAATKTAVIFPILLQSGLDISCHLVSFLSDIFISTVYLFSACAFLRSSRSRLARRHHRLGARSGLRSRLVYCRSGLSWSGLRAGLMYSGARLAWLRSGLVYSGSRFAWLRSRLVYSRAGFAGLRTGLVYSGSRFAWLRPRLVYSGSGFRRGLMYPGLRPRSRFRTRLRSRRSRCASRHHRHRYERRRNFSRVFEKIARHSHTLPFLVLPEFFSSSVPTIIGT